MNPTSDTYEGEWYAFENGATVNDNGENGVILRDEQLGDEAEPEDADARITLEQGWADNPGFFVTATIYGWLFVTAKRTNRADGDALYEEMKAGLARLAALIPYEEDGKKVVAEKAQALSDGAADFERRYGS